MIDLIKDLKERELVCQTTNEDDLINHLSSSRTLYCGFDPTADSLHIGSLVPLLTLKRFQDAGHKPIILVGGATGMIGDPSFKNNERNLNDKEIVFDWVKKIKNQTKSFFSFNGSNSAEVVNNNDWVSNINVIHFLRDIGKNFSINSMLQKESIKQRIEREESGISFTEFSYMLLQSLDFAELNNRFNCSLQIGGSDQWGNISEGISLTRKLNQKKVFGLTMPLVTKSDGTKFGKTENGTIWLDKNKTSVFSFFQFWINTSDDDVEKFLKFFTFLSIEDINKIISSDKERKENGEKPIAQEILACEVTDIVHGKDERLKAQNISKALFGGLSHELDESSLEQLALDGMPSIILDDNLTILDIMSSNSLVKSKRIGREIMQNNSVKLNGEIINEDIKISNENMLFNKFSILKVGKKKHLMIIKS